MKAVRLSYCVVVVRLKSILTDLTISMSAPSFDLMTPAETIAESNGKSYWLCVILIGGEEFGVKIQSRRTGRSAWYVQLYRNSLCKMSIPFPSIERDRLGNLECAVLIEEYMKARDPDSDVSISKVGDRHSKRKVIKPKKALSAKKAAIEKPWSDCDRDLEIQIGRINRVKYKTALQERQLASLKSRLKADPSRWLVGMGVGYRVSRNQINRGFRITKTKLSEKMVLVSSVSDCGLTSSGGDFDRTADCWVYVSDLIRDKRFDSRDGFSI